jgi:hypothetical protein
MIFELLLSGSAIWRQGLGIPICQIKTLVDEEVKNFDLGMNHLDSDTNQLTSE